MKLRSYTELLNEIARVKAVLSTAKSPKLRRDYSTHLQRLCKERKEFELNYYGK